MKRVLNISGLCHAYGSHRVLSELSFTLFAGEITGIIGENGAGKSTLVKCILGMVKPYAGSLELDCTATAIHQELNLAAELPVYANFFLGRELRNRFGLLDVGTMIERVRQGFEHLNVKIDPCAETGTLSVSERQMVEIARALDINAQLLILDEPSALLSTEETERLFEIMRKLKASGTAMIYISHKLDEVRNICDRVAILRDGELVAAGKAQEMTARQMAERMVGRDLANVYPKIAEASGEVALTFSSNTVGSFDLHVGEILGVAGLAGAGQTELGEIVAGLRPLPSGQMRLFGKPVKFRSAADAHRAGTGILTANRLVNGIWRDFSISENIALGALERMCVHGLVSEGKVQSAAAKYVRDFKIRCESHADRAGTLSGGNQQKVALAKTLADMPQVVVLNDPTQGVDVGARQEIYHVIGKLAQSGLAILLISSDLTELLGMCARVLVVRQGAIVDEVFGGRRDEKTIIRIATATDREL